MLAHLSLPQRLRYAAESVQGSLSTALMVRASAMFLIHLVQPALEALRAAEHAGVILGAVAPFGVVLSLRSFEVV